MLQLFFVRRFRMTTIRFLMSVMIILGCFSCSNQPAKDQQADVNTESTTLDHRAGFLGKMSASHMQSLQKACMKSQKNETKCNEKLMEDCSVELSKTECQKMMAEAKISN